MNATLPHAWAEAYDALDHAHQARRSSDVAALLALVACCDRYQVTGTQIVEGCERLLRLGGDGTPVVGEFLAAEVGALLEVGPTAAKRQIGQALNLRHRHPQLWEATVTGLVPVYQALLVADACVTAGLSAEACGWVDRQCAIALCLNPFTVVLRELPGWIIAADPQLAAEKAAWLREHRFVRVDPIWDGHASLSGRLSAGDGIALDEALDVIAGELPAGEQDHDQRRAAALGIMAKAILGQDQLPPDTTTPNPDAVAGAGGVRRATVVVHVTDQAVGAPGHQVARVEGWGHVLAGQIGEILAGCQVTVRPIIDPATVTPTDSFTVPDLMRLVVEQRNPVEVFPYGTRAAASCDLDHTEPFDPSLPAGHGQTRPEILGPLSRYCHRVTTHGGWQVTQAAPGVFEWRSPAGYEYHVTRAGSVRVRRPRPAAWDWWNQELPAPLDHDDHDDDPLHGRLRRDRNADTVPAVT